MADKVALRKRQQITSSNKMMFIWVAGASAVVGACIVLAWFLVQQIVFQTTVANQYDETAGRLVKNKEVLDSLSDDVKVLETNAGLNSVKSTANEKALQVVLDALPADNNELALGASLQQNLIAPVSGVTVESLSVGGEGGTVNTSETTVAQVGTISTIPIRLVVSASDANALKDLLVRFEKSIRVIDIDDVVLDRSDAKYTLTLQAHAYYQPGKTIQLGSVTCKPEGKGCK